MSICLAVVLCHVVLAVMCIYVIYKCLSLDFDQQQDLCKPSLKVAKLSQQSGKSCRTSYPTW
jgi:hypothetical protein